MATLAEPQRPAATGEERFFLVMAIVMGALIFAGFAFALAAGRSTFASPILFHVHAFFFFGWIALYIAQNALVATGNVAVHRRLGWLAVIWVPAMLVLGVLMTVHSVQTHGGPPFFDVNEFLIANPILLLYFAGLVATAISMRRRTDWHRRLMYSAMAILLGPGFGRLLPMPLLIPYAWWISTVVPTLAFIAIGMIADRGRGLRLHPAWLWAAAGLLATQGIIDVIAYSPLGLSITHAVVDGTPGGQRDFKAHMP